MCDPNDQGAPPRSTLEVAIRRDDASLLELLLQYQADPQLREAGQELPIIVAASRGTLSCVQILLAYGADPGATEQLPSAEHPGQAFSIVRRKTAIDASLFPAIVEALQTAISAVKARPDQRWRRHVQLIARNTFVHITTHSQAAAVKNQAVLMSCQEFVCSVR